MTNYISIYSYYQILFCLCKPTKYIAFASNRENPKKDNKHIYVMKADGTDLIQITQGETDESDPAWGNDLTIFFSSNAEKNYNIWKAKVKIGK
jgi:TolB protein